LELDKSIDANIKIVSISGQIVGIKKKVLSKGLNNFSIQAPKEKGFYFLHIQYGRGQQIVRKVIVH